jgi:hypothetical protein
MRSLLRNTWQRLHHGLSLYQMKTAHIAVGRSECWWPVSESNQGHADFQSAALPTELTGLSVAIRRHIKKQAFRRRHPQPNALVLGLRASEKHQKTFFCAHKPGEYKRDVRFCEAGACASKVAPTLCGQSSWLDRMTVYRPQGGNWNFPYKRRRICLRWGIGIVELHTPPPLRFSKRLPEKPTGYIFKNITDLARIDFG